MRMAATAEGCAKKILLLVTEELAWLVGLAGMVGFGVRRGYFLYSAWNCTLVKYFKWGDFIIHRHLL